MQEAVGLVDFVLLTNCYYELVLVFQETNVKESVQVDNPTDQKTLTEQTDNSNLWTEELNQEVQNLETQSEKHAAKQDSHKDENSHEFIHVHSSDEHLKKENLKSNEELDLSKTSDGTDRQEQKTETQGKIYQSKDSTHQETKDDKLGSDSETSQHLEDSKMETKTKSSQRNKKTAKLKQGQSKKKTTDHDEMAEWADDDYYGVDDDDEPYDEDMDEDLDDEEPLEGSEDTEDFPSGKEYSEVETDSIESWQMTEKPLDESEDFSDEEGDHKIKEQEELQEEIKQLKGKWFR